MQKTRPTLAYLDIKSAYETVDRNIICNALTSTFNATAIIAHHHHHHHR
jgi:hypothetical protein